MVRMTLDEARESLLRDFHKTRYTEKISVDPYALAVLLYGEQPGEKSDRKDS